MLAHCFGFTSTVPSLKICWFSNKCLRYCIAMQYPTAIEMLQEGRIDVKPMITHRFGFSGRDEVIAGFECAANAAKTKAIKVMFNLPGEE